MANIYNTRLECISNDQLLKHLNPAKIIVNTSSEFLSLYASELIFDTSRETLHRDIILLSERFPREIFHARFYDLDGQIYNNSPGLCYKYENGHEQFLGYEPYYIGKNYKPIIEAFGEDVYYRLWKRIRKYLSRLDLTKVSLLDDESRCDPLEHHFDDCVDSSITIHAEFENYKMTVDKLSNYTLIFKGYKRISSSDNWEGITVPIIEQEE